MAISVVQSVDDPVSDDVLYDDDVLHPKQVDDSIPFWVFLVCASIAAAGYAYYYIDARAQRERLKAMDATRGGNSLDFTID